MQQGARKSVGAGVSVIQTTWPILEVNPTFSRISLHRTETKSHLGRAYKELADCYR